MALNSGSTTPESTSSSSVEGQTDSSDSQNNCSNNKKDTEISEWDYEEFDPKRPYLYEPLTYPADQSVLHLPIEVEKRHYIPLYSLPKRLPRKRVHHSPEIKPKISRKTGQPKRSSQFLGPDSPSEDSD